MTPKKITLFYGHVASNLGDLAINQGEGRLLRSAFPEASLQVVFMDAEKSQFLQSAKASFESDSPVFFTYLNANYEKGLVYHAHPERLLIDCGANDSDLIVLASSELLFAYSRPENLKSLFWRTLPALAAKADQKPCILLPSTFGPFEDPKSSDLISSFLSLVDRYAARESYSARSLQARFKLDGQPVLMDPAFFIDTRHLSRSADSFTDGLGARVLGLSMRSEAWGVRLLREQRENLSESFRANSFNNSTAFQFSVGLSKRFLENDPEASLFLFVQTVADEELANHIAGSLSESGFGERIRLIKPISVQDYISHLAHVDYVVASRFHAVILSLLLGKPVFGVFFETHGHKMPGLFDFLGISSECVDLSVISPEAGVQSALQSIAQPIHTWPEVQGRIADYKDQTVSWVADDSNRSLDSKAFFSAFGAFGDLASSLARTGFETTKRQSVKVLQQQLMGLKTKLSEAEKLSQKALEKAQSQLKEAEGLMKAARKQAQTHQTQAQELEKQAKEARQQALSQAQKLKQELQEARQQGHVQQAKAQELEQELQEARQQGHVQQAKAQELERQAIEVRQQAQAEAKLLKSRLATMEQQEVETKKFHQRELDRVRRKTKDLVKSHLSYRLGKVLVESANPFRWPALPYRLYRARKEYQNDNAVIALIASDAQMPGQTLPEGEAAPAAIEDQADTANGVLTPESISSALENQGIQAAIKLVDNMNRKETPRVRAMALIRTGKALWDRGQEEAEFPFAQTALEIDRSEPLLRAFFWAAQRAQAYAQSCDTILELEKIYGDKPTPVQQDLLQKLKAAPAYQLSVLKETTPSRILKVSGIPGRMCYVLHNTLPYSSGGYATRSHGVATGLKKAGWDVTILSRPGFPLDIKPELTEPDVVAADSIDGIAYIRTLFPKRTGISAREYMLAAADAIEVQLREYRPSIVMAASNHVTGLPALIAARRAGLPFIYEVRGLWEITRMSRENEFKDKAAFHVQKTLEASVAGRADHVFTLTEAMRQELVERGVPQEKIDLLPNSCDPVRFHPIEKDQLLATSLGIPVDVPVVGYVGTFVDYEGLEDLAEACALLKQRGVEFRLLMVGNENASGQDRGPISEQILQIAERNQFTDWLIMPGRVPHEEVERYYSLIDIAPFPRKPWPVCEMVSPMKPLEAMAMEKAVVVSSVRALSDMIEHEKTGLVFEKGDINSLADTLNRLIDSQDLRIALGAQGRKWVQEERTWDRVGEKASSVIAPLLENFAN